MLNLRSTIRVFAHHSAPVHLDALYFCCRLSPSDLWVWIYMRCSIGVNRARGIACKGMQPALNIMIRWSRPSDAEYSRVGCDSMSSLLLVVHRRLPMPMVKRMGLQEEGKLHQPKLVRLRQAVERKVEAVRVKVGKENHNEAEVVLDRDNEGPLQKIRGIRCLE